MAATMRSITPGSTMKCWPNLLRGTCRRVATASLARLPRPGARHADRRFDRFQEAVGLRAPGPGDVGRSPVVDRGAHDRQPERDVDALAEARVLEDRQALIVVHRERAVRARQPVRNEQRVCWERTLEAHPLRA